MEDAPLRLSLDRDGRLLRLALARPPANILDAPMIAALAEAFERHRGARALRAVLVSHEGPEFSFGASVAKHLPDRCAAMLAAMSELLLLVLTAPVPVLVAVRGRCLGGGLELAAAAMRIFAAPAARFGQPEIKLGVFAPYAGVLLPARIGDAGAADLLLTGRTLPAAEALAIGLVDDIADDPEAAALAYFDTHLADKSAIALRHATRAVRGPFAEQAAARFAAIERAYLDELMQTHDAVEGLTAFLEKRPPVWRDE